MTHYSGGIIDYYFFRKDVNQLTASTIRYEEMMRSLFECNLDSVSRLFFPFRQNNHYRLYSIYREFEKCRSTLLKLALFDTIEYKKLPV